MVHTALWPHGCYWTQISTKNESLFSWSTFSQEQKFDLMPNFEISCKQTDEQTNKHTLWTSQVTYSRHSWNTRSAMTLHKEEQRKDREPWAISSCLRVSPRAENRSSLMRVSALRLHSRCWAFSCMADRVDSSMSVSFSTQWYFPKAWVQRTH